MFGKKAHETTGNIDIKAFEHWVSTNSGAIAVLIEFLTIHRALQQPLFLCLCVCTFYMIVQSNFHMEFVR